MEPDEIEEILQSGVRDGLFEVAQEGDAPGSTKYRLTDFGSVEAQQTVASEGLPFLVFIISVDAVKNGKLDRTVKSMSDEAIAKFPNKLKRQTKINFAPFWNEYASISPAEYIEVYRETEDKSND